jgi:hypothetical protein
VGRAGGNVLVGVAFRGLSSAFPPPLNYAVGLAAFQLFFIPTGIMYWLASRTVARDMTDVHELLQARAIAERPTPDRSDAADGPDAAGGHRPAGGPDPAAGDATRADLMR